MSLEERIKLDMVTAWKAKENQKRDFLKVVISELERESDAANLMTDEKAIKILTKLSKNAVEMKNDFEIEILKSYLPTLMTEDEIEEAIHFVTSTMDASEFNTGRIMGAFNKEFKGKADNKIVSQKVKEFLS